MRGLLRPSGRPRYVKGKVSSLYPKRPAKRVTFSLETLIGSKQDLAKLTLKPVDWAKVSRMLLRHRSCREQACIISKVSSVYWIIGNSPFTDGMGC